MTLADRLPISSHDSFRPGTVEATTSPCVSKPMISIPTELVLPLSTSCLCRKRFTLALPRPSSRLPFTSTPSIVLLPASTLPTTAILVSMTSSIDAGDCRMSNLPSSPFDFSFFVSASSGPPTLCVRRMRQSALSALAAALIRPNARSHCSLFSIIDSPLSSCPQSKIVSPWPSSSRFCNREVSCCSDSSESAEVSRRRSLSGTLFAVSERSSESRTSSSACSSVTVDLPVE